MPLLQSTKKAVTGVNNTTLAFGSDLTAGSLICVTQAHYIDPGASISTPTDTLTQTYLPMTDEQSWSSAGDIAALRGFYVPDCSAGADTVTFDIIGSGAGYITIVIAEFSEIAAVSPLDQIAVGAGTSTDVVTSATPTTSEADELLWGGMMHGGTTTSIDETAGGLNGYTLVQEEENATTYAPISVEYQIVAAITSYTASWIIGASFQFVCFVATFKLASPSVPPEPAQVYPFPFSQPIG